MTAPAQSNTHNGLCRFDGPPGIDNRRAPTAMKFKPTAAAIAAYKYLALGVVGVGLVMCAPRFTETLAPLGLRIA
jgi:hypothetical protein